MKSSSIAKLLISVTVLLSAVLISVSYYGSIKTVRADNGFPNYFYASAVTVSSGVSVNTSNTLLLATSTGRVYAVVVNDGSNPVYISLSGLPASVGAGIRLNATGGSYEINGLNLYDGAINAIASGGMSNVTVTAAQ